MEKTWNVAIYARVSTDKKEQTESIPAQVESLKNWLIEKRKTENNSHYVLTEVYEDAGFSGSNFQRDSFIRMKNDIEKGIINMILTRDLSRFSRNYIMAGYYIEDYFKVNNIRFVSVLDNVDTLEEVNDIVPFKNILNEMYIKDCSKRTKDGLKQRMLRGSSIASKPPYGYKFKESFNGNVKTIRLIPAGDETTEVVKTIYSLFIKGWSIGKICTFLNHRGILPPSYKCKNFVKAKYGVWTNNTIKSILTNPKYAGRMVQHRWNKISYKMKKITPVDESEWILGDDFEGIIHKDVFDQVQNIIKDKNNSNKRNAKIKHTFSSVLICGDCGGPMCYRKSYKGYKCTHSQIGGRVCSAHSIKEEFLANIIEKELKDYINKFIDKGKIYEKILDTMKDKNSTQRELKGVIKQIEKIDRIFNQIYEDRLNNVINETNSQNLIAEIQRKQIMLIQKKEELQKQIIEKENINNYYEDMKGNIDEILRFENIDKFDVEALIKKIIVYEDKETGEKTVQIYYKFSAS